MPERVQKEVVYGEEKGQLEELKLKGGQNGKI